jgi:hypothetical protein
VGDCPIRQLVLREKIWVGWFTGVWTQKYCDLFGWWPLRLVGKSLQLRAPWLGKACPFLNYTLAFALQLRKITDNHSQSGRVVGDYSLRRLGWLLMEGFGWPAENQSTSVSRGWLQSALGRQKCLPSCRTKGFLASAIFESKLSVSALMWSAKNGISIFSWICLLLTYKSAVIAMRRHLDFSTCSFRMWLRAANFHIGHA